MSIGDGKSPIRIGVSLPLGVSAETDPDVAAVAVDVKNALNFGAGKFQADVELVILDNRYDAARCSQVAGEFVRLRVAAVLGLPMSKEVKASAPILEKAKIPIVSSMATSPELVKYPGVFRTRPHDGHVAEVLLQFLHKRGISHLSVISEASDYPLDCSKEFATTCARSGVRCPVFQFSDLNVDFFKLLQCVAAESPPAVFINAQREDTLVMMLQKVRSILGSIQVFSASLPESQRFKELAGSLAQGLVFVQEPSMIRTVTTTGHQYLSQFKAMHGEPKTWDGAIISTLTSLFVIKECIRSGVGVENSLKNMWFDDPMNGGFRFEQNERRSFGEQTFSLGRYGLE